MLEALIAVINERHGAAFVPGERYPTGEQGAFALVEGEGEAACRYVLKWDPGTDVPETLRQAVAITERLRAVGYPVPDYRLVGVAPELGVVYAVQTALPGEPLRGRLDRATLDRLVALSDLQAGRALATEPAWPRPIASPVLSGGDGFCLHAPLRAYSTATAALLDTLKGIAVADQAMMAAADVVHFDFQGWNILVAGDEISGVVDWGGALAGDRLFDLTTLYFYADPTPDEGADARDRLWRLLTTRLPACRLGLYLAHLILRQVDWSIRFHDGETVARWLARAESELRRLAGTFQPADD